MKQPVMKNVHQPGDPFVLPLPAGQALTLRAEPRARALWMHEGSVWLTRSCSRRSARACAGALPPDVVLRAGASFTLPAGSEWVVEALSTARVSIVQAAPRVQGASASRFRPGAWLASGWRRWQRRHPGAAAYWA